ncbi:unnamed protein product, partial [Chrysoparadoxa australica]
MQAASPDQYEGEPAHNSNYNSSESSRFCEGLDGSRATYRAAGTARPMSAGCARKQYDPHSDIWRTTSSLANVEVLKHIEQVREYVRRPQSAAAARQRTFLSSERDVHRFYGYFLEHAQWTNTDPLGMPAYPAAKVRRIVLYHFLEDSSIKIVEARQPNSGHQGGLLLRRDVFLRRDNKPYGSDDLRIGEPLYLLGRTFHLVDCDGQTRAAYEAASCPQPQPMPYPSHVQHELRIEHTTGLGAPKLVGERRRPASAGRARSSSPTKGMPTKRFLDHEKEVLRFDLVWDDPTPGGKRNRYHLLYHLEDDTCEVLNRKEDMQNSGCDDGPVYLKRQ